MSRLRTSIDNSECTEAMMSRPGEQRVHYVTATSSLGIVTIQQPENQARLYFKQTQPVSHAILNGLLLLPYVTHQIRCF